MGSPPGASAGVQALLAGLPGTEQPPRPGPSSPPAAPLPQAAEEDLPKRKEQTHFTVRLTEAKPVDKVKLIKEIKSHIQGINLVQVSPARAQPSLSARTLAARPGPGLTFLSGRRRSWWNPCPRKSKPTCPKLRLRRSRRPWRRWAAPWFWSRLPGGPCTGVRPPPSLPVWGATCSPTSAQAQWTERPWSRTGTCSAWPAPSWDRRKDLLRWGGGRPRLGPPVAGLWNLPGHAPPGGL